VTTKLGVARHLSIVLPYVGFEDWTPQWVQAFIDLFSMEFGLQNDIRVVGLVKAKKNTSRGSTDEFYDQVCWCFVFVVHEDDEQQICNIHRLDLGVRWLFDVVADNNMKKRLPKAFLTMYDE
jgi:hypothetical protein